MNYPGEYVLMYLCVSENDLHIWHTDYYTLHSAGHCAQYCTYTTTEQESLDKRETNRNSVIMEKECFFWTMDLLLPELHIKEAVTNAHPQITALLSK